MKDNHTYRIECESAQSFLEVGRRSNLLLSRNIERFRYQEETENGKCTANDGLDVKDPSPSQVLVNETTTDGSNGRTENCAQHVETHSSATFTRFKHVRDAATTDSLTSTCKDTLQ